MSTIAEIFETLEYGPAPESTGPAMQWLEEHGRQFGVFVANEWRDPAAGEYFDTSNPANNRPLARIAQGSAEDVDAAVRAARAAFPGWSGLSGHARARYLYAIARQIQKHSRLFATLESLDNGKPIRESRDIDIPLVARHFYHHAGWAQLLESELPDQAPLGVVGQIIPWNFPLLMLAWKIAPALATGNTVVLKPAEFTSLTALRFAEVCRDVGLPAGVVNIVTGDGRTGEALVKHPDVDKIAFTGSTEVGRIIRIATAGSGKKLSLELYRRDDGTDVDSLVERIPDAQRLHARAQLLDEAVIDPFLRQDTRAGAADLPLIEPDRIHHPLDHAIEVGILEDDKRRLATQLERKLFAAASCSRADDPPYFGRAGKGDLVNIRMSNDELANLAITGNNVDDSRRQANFGADFGKREGCQ
ncbi:MAG TPA: aldehyde dehydrogenase family protein [Longimicrobiaceae bacterium]|nr:aldehyde dehydrogenase family protein [Longimicrobiaceae bacterium]